MRRTLRLHMVPFRNLRTRPFRTGVLLLLVFAQAACVLGGLMMTQSMQKEMTRTKARLGADILVYPAAAMSKISGKTLLMQGSPVEIWKDRSMLSRIDACDDIAQVAYQIYIRDTTGKAPVWIVGFDGKTDFVITPWIRDGCTPERGIIVGSKVQVSDDHVTLFSRTWPVSARLDETGSELDEMAFVDMETLKSLLKSAEEAGITAYQGIDPDRDFSVALIRVSSKEKLDSVTSWLNVYVRKVKAVRSEETLSDTSEGIRKQMSMIVVIAVAAWVVLLTALAIAQSMMMKERKKELFVWHAIGASRAIVNRVMLTEALIVYGIGGLMGAGFCAVLLPVVFGIKMNMSALLLFALLTVFLTILIGLVSTRIAVRKATESMNGQMLLTV